MPANRLEQFTVEVIKRNQIMKADYNPRKISESAAKKLRKFLKTHGLWNPLIVNRRTMTLVSGHQRIDAMDTILRKNDYAITVSMVDVDEETEVKGNIFMNNQSAMGEFDFLQLKEINTIFPEIDFSADLGFDDSDIDVILGDAYIAPVEVVKQREEKATEEMREEFTPESMRELKKEMREKNKSENSEGESYKLSESDYHVTFVFPNNSAKHNFMKRINKPISEKYVKSAVLMDIFNHVYNLSILGE